jgi:HSP20 family protein
VDLSETEESLVLRAEIAGMKPEDLEISISNDVLTLRGEATREDETDEEGYRSTERGSRSFSRTIQLPCKVEINEVKATYKDGLLSVVMPKCKPEPPREIKVKVG